jgi:hypothetical protein
MKNKVSCSLCKKEKDSPEPINDFVLYCTECMTEIFHSLAEDWKFEPTVASGMYTMSDPNYSLSNLKRVPPEEDAMPNYKHSVDPSTIKSNKLQKFISKLNVKNSGDIIKYDSPENTPGA